MQSALLLFSAAAMLVAIGDVMMPVHGFYVPHSQVVKRSAELVRNKRYTDFQERASAFCTGMCMYQQRQPYSECFDACNWTGRGQSPWAKFDAAAAASAAAAANDQGNSVENIGAMMRTGGKSKTRTTGRG